MALQLGENDKKKWVVGEGTTAERFCCCAIPESSGGGLSDVYTMGSEEQRVLFGLKEEIAGVKGEIHLLKMAVEDFISRVNKGLNSNMGLGLSLGHGFAKNKDGPRSRLNPCRVDKGKAKLAWAWA